MMYRKIAVNRNSEPSVTLNGKTTALASLLVKYRPLLVMEAARTMDQQIRSRLSASDLVQQTLLEAHRDIKNFNGEVEGQFVN